MSQLAPLLQALKETDLDSHAPIMATVVQVKGSAYRRPGARMLVMPFGQSVGMISGGCLEHEVCKKAAWLTSQNDFALKRYSTGSIEHFDPVLAQFEEEADDDEALAFGLGCNGQVTVLFEKLDRKLSQYLLRHLQRVQASQRAGVVATVIAAPHIDQKTDGFCVGDRVYLDPISLEITWQNKSGDLAAKYPKLNQSITQEVSYTLTRQQSHHQIYALYGGELELFFEYIAPPHRLVIFGAGHDAQPLATLAKMQGWHVTVIDSRAHFARAERFPQADQVFCFGLNEPVNLNDLTQGAVAVVMSHSLSQDRHWLKQLLLAPPRYIGQLGPRYRTERLISEIQEQMLQAAGSQPVQIEHSLEHGLEVLHYPVGLDIGGDTPESIALAIMAEITACLNQRSAKMLKQRETAIHAE